MEIIKRVYAPSSNQRLALGMISLVVVIGIFGQLLLSDWFLIGAIIFWMQYTAMLSFLQFSRHKYRSHDSLTEILLIPHIRFFVFIFIATIGLVGTVKGQYYLGYITLSAWWLFSVNFYRHYNQFRKFE
ncbi:MAG: hypothetical protein KKE20_01330 [Nanoarchaeota archaeon]|nr:hypothetical protein [Nanoarchaeota archaeon]